MDRHCRQVVLVLAAILLQAVVGLGVAHADTCPGGFRWSEIIGRCVAIVGSPHDSAVVIRVDTNKPDSFVTNIGPRIPDTIAPSFEYFVAPACLGNGPGLGDAGCESAACLSVDKTPGTLIIRWRRPADHSADWERLPGSTCFTGTGPPPAQPPALTAADLAPDVASALRTIGIASSSVSTDPSGETLAQLETIFTADTPPTFSRHITLLGIGVQVDLRPSSWSWSFGDGATATTSTPGRHYPERDVVHIYRQTGRYPANVSVTWGGTFTALGQTLAIPGTVDISGTPAQVTVREARARIVN